jgi:hypothetical protein
LPTAVPFLAVFLADHPRPTRRQGSGGDRHLKFYEPRDNLDTAKDPWQRAWLVDATGMGDRR